MAEIEGIQTRAHDVPGVRRKVPAPFTRPSINLDGARRIKRAWQDIKVLDIQRGDTVADFGMVETVVEVMNVPTRAQFLSGTTMTWIVRMQNVMGETREWPAEQRVYAFCPQPEQPAEPGVSGGHNRR